MWISVMYFPKSPNNYICSINYLSLFIEINHYSRLLFIGYSKNNEVKKWKAYEVKKVNRRITKITDHITILQ